MKRPRQNSAVARALYVNAALLGGILLVLIGRNGTPSFTAPAFGAPMAQPIAGGGSIYLMPAQFSLNTFGCYLMDIDKQTLCAYQFKPGSTQLQFVAARQFTSDLKLKLFNTGPDPDEIKKMIDAQQKGVRGVFEVPSVTPTPVAPDRPEGTPEKPEAAPEKPAASEEPAKEQ